MMNKVALVTGASSGIGWHTAIALRKAGMVVYGAARRLERLQKLTEWGIIPVELDVTDDTSMTSCVHYVEEREHRIDILVNGAGYGFYGAVEDVPLAAAREQLEVNLFGLARMTQLVLPLMRRQQSGRIINISSVAGRAWTPFGAWYHTSKYAVEGFSDALRWETQPFGIKVILIEPGIIKTDWGNIAAHHLRETSLNGPYGIETEAMAETMETVYNSNKGTQPESVARCIAGAALASEPKTRYLIGRGAWQLVLMRHLLGDKNYDKLARWIILHVGHKIEKWL